MSYDPSALANVISELLSPGAGDDGDTDAGTWTRPSRRANPTPEARAARRAWVGRVDLATEVLVSVSYRRGTNSALEILHELAERDPRALALVAAHAVHFLSIAEPPWEAAERVVGPGMADLTPELAEAVAEIRAAREAPDGGALA